jgi:hypothetical protein
VISILDSYGLTKSLPLPVLTRSKCDSAFEAKPVISFNPGSFGS